MLFKYDVFIELMTPAYNDYEENEISAREDKSVASEKIMLTEKIVADYIRIYHSHLCFVYDSKHLCYLHQPMPFPFHIGEIRMDHKAFLIKMSFSEAQRIGDLDQETLEIFGALLISQALKHRLRFEPLQYAHLYVPEDACYENRDGTGVILRLAYKRTVYLTDGGDTPSNEVPTDFIGGAIVVRDIKLEPTFGSLFSLYDLWAKRRLHGEGDREIEDTFQGVCFRVCFDPKQRIKFARFSDGPIGDIQFEHGNVADYFNNKFGVFVNPTFKAMVTEKRQFYPIEFVYPVQGQFVGKKEREKVNDWKEFRLLEHELRKKHEELFHQALNAGDFADFFQFFGMKTCGYEDKPLSSLQRSRSNSGAT
uniref:Uncharacterized protein n=2 Tax=Bursaphelenchus xylophilus TaxID=6326 RepID=A0A1I7RJN6_BURXY